MSYPKKLETKEIHSSLFLHENLFLTINRRADMIDSLTAFYYLMSVLLIQMFRCKLVIVVIK